MDSNSSIPNQADTPLYASGFNKKQGNINQQPDIPNSPAKKRQFLLTKLTITVWIFVGVLIITGLLLYFMKDQIFSLFGLKENDAPYNSAVQEKSAEKEMKGILDKLPYTVLSIDQNDKTGRTMVYKDRVRIDLFERKATEGIGWVYFSPFNNEKRQFKNGITGYFQEKQDITGSKDKYIFIKIPELQDPVKARLLIDPIEVPNGTVSAKIASHLGIEDLSVLVDKKDKPGYGFTQIGSPSAYTKGDLNNMLKKGDVITLIFIKNPNRLAPLEDEEGNPQIDLIILRRLGGLEQLRNEVLGAFYGI